MKVYAIALLVILVSTGCLTARPPRIAEPTPNFSWEPPSKEPSSGMSISMVTPALSSESKLGSYNQNKYFEMFMRSLQGDLERTLLAKGFIVKGPFRSLDDMTYPDKKAAPLTLFPEVVLVLNESYTLNVAEPGPFGSQSVRRQGTVAASGLVKFTVIEPMSVQKIWLKKVDLPQATSTIDVDLFMDETGRLNQFHDNRDNSDAAVIDVLNKAYPEIMQKFWSYLNGEEIAAMRRSADEVRARKVY